MGVGYYIGTQGGWGNYFTQNFMYSESHTESYPLFGGSHYETDSGDIRFFAQYVGRHDGPPVHLHAGRCTALCHGALAVPVSGLVGRSQH